MLNVVEQRKAAKEFAAKWKDRGYEKGDTQSFWFELLQNIFDVKKPTDFIKFEKQVKLDHVSFVDGMIASTKVMIEQKGVKVDLEKKYKQSSGPDLTPFEQAKRYADALPNSRRPDYIVICNFQEFHIHDLEHPQAPVQKIALADLPEEYYRLSFLTDANNTHIKQEMELSLEAGAIVGQIYDALLKRYIDPQAESTLKSLNVLCVRLVFCLYAEDADLFDKKSQFHDYLAKFDAENLRGALINLFKVLNTPEEKRDPYLEQSLAEFPYVNGGLFADMDIEIPQFDEHLKKLLLEKASDDFNWRNISSTIFGAVFESTLNPETRRSGGMHYTSVENIHKVIDPLFLDDLTAELEAILELKVPGTRNAKLGEFHRKISGLTFFDPACGSGNFLTEIYLSLRKLENRVIDALHGAGQKFLLDPISVSIGNFYGLEINDFAVAVAKTAMWIAESQTRRITEDILGVNLKFLPLVDYANIVEGNALTVDWNTVIPKEKLNYIIGNPPFVGAMMMSEAQRKEIAALFPDCPQVGEIDYVAGWYAVARAFIQNTEIKCAFVSTNSICQGQQAYLLWKPLFEYGIHIDFAYRTFRWDSEASSKAHVHCVIIGFSSGVSPKNKQIFDGNNVLNCRNINAYLVDAPDVFIASRSKPVCAVPEMRFGSMARDGGHFFLTPEEKDSIISATPQAAALIKRFVGAKEFIKNKERYVLWMLDASPALIGSNKEIIKRIEAVRAFRAASKAAATRAFAQTPTVFCQLAQPDKNYLLIPRHSSERRPYVPIGYMSAEVICGDANLLIPDAELYHFGVLTSIVHMAWMRAVAGRIKSDYRYSKDVVYNNFIWPDLDEGQKKTIAECARAILDVRAKDPDSSLAALYNPNSMPPELLKAHQANDKAVMKAYGYSSKMSEAEIVADLMRRYQELTGQKQ